MYAESAAKKTNFSEIFKLKQIFGKISKYAMCDAALSCEAKSLYSVLVCYAGNRQFAYPTVETLCRNLNIGKERLRTILFELISHGYIKVGKMKSYGNFERNTYDIVSCPPKYEKEPQNERDTVYYERIRKDGIQSCCYGIIPQSVMLDAKIDITAKGIYAYLCSFSGNTNTAYPTVKNMCYHLHICENTYRKYMRQLIKSGYVRVIQHKDNGRFSECEYILTGHPNADRTTSYTAKAGQTATAKKTPVTINRITVPMFRTETNDIPAFEPAYNNIDSIDIIADVQSAQGLDEHACITNLIPPGAEQYGTTPPITLPSTTIPTTNTNSANTNSFNITLQNFSIPQIANSYPKNKINKKNIQARVNQSDVNLNHISAKKDGLTTNIAKNKDAIYKDLLNNKSINPQYLQNKEFTRIIIDILSQYTTPCTSDYWHKTILTCLSQMLFNSGHSENQKYNPLKVANMINSHIVVSYNSVSFDSWLEEFEKSFNKSVQNPNVSKNIVSDFPYAKRSIWDFLVHYVSQKDKSGLSDKRSSFDVDEFFNKAVLRANRKFS